MFKPWISIPVEEAKVSVDYNFGDIRIMFKSAKTVDNVIEQLMNLRSLVEEMEGADCEEVDE